MLIVCCGWRHGSVVVHQGERESMDRRIELGAGIGAAVLSFIGLIALMFAPIITRCASGQVRNCPQRDIRYESLMAQAHVDASVWIVIIGMLLVVLIGAAGAIAEAGFGLRGGMIPLWSGAIITFAGCLIVQGIGLFYFPAIIALAIAAGASLRRQRILARQVPEPTPDEAVAGEAVPDEANADEAERRPDSGASES